MVALNQSMNVAIDPLEDRYRKINPLLLYFLYIRRFWGSLSLLLLVISIAVIGMAVIAAFLREGSVGGVLPAMGLAHYAVVLALLIAALVLDLIMRNPGKIFGLFGLLYVLGVLLVSLPGLLLGLDGAGKVIEAVSAVSPWLALLLFIPVPFAVFFYFHVIWVLGRASFNLLAASKAERELMRDVPRRSSMLGNVFLRILSLPPLFEFARRPRARFAAIIFLSILAAVFLSMLSIFSVASPSTSLRAFHALSEDCIGSLPNVFGGYDAAEYDKCANRRAPGVLGLAVALPAMIVVLLFLGSGLQSLVRRMVRFSLEDLQRVDMRAPLLFLRAFGDDQVPLKPEKAPLFTRLIEIGRRRTSLDQMLIEEGTPFGPVVALGNPRDRRPPYGAARGYFDDKDWQGAVTDLANNSAVVVICLDDTDGIWWEIEHLVTRGHLGKTLFLVHPKFARSEANREFLTRISTALGGGGALEPLLQPSPAGSRGKPANVVGFFLDNDRLQVVRSSTFSRLAYLLTLRMFLRGRLDTVPA